MQIPVAEFLTSALDPAGWPPAGPPEVAFVGRSNVGKSSLLNALASRRGLARVSSAPGRTRTLNFYRVVPGPGPEMRLVDLPGFGYAAAPRAVRADFRSQVEPYLMERPTLRAVVLLVDLRRGPEEEELTLGQGLAEAGRTVVVVATKADQVPRARRFPLLERVRAALPGGAPIPFSARTGEGRDDLWRRLRALTR